MGGLSLGSAVSCSMVGDFLKGAIYRSYIRPTILYGSYGVNQIAAFFRRIWSNSYVGDTT